MKQKDKKGFLSLIELFVAILIITLLAYVGFNIYNKTFFGDEKIAQQLSEADLDTTNYQTTLESTKKKIETFNKQLLEREDQFFKMAE